MGTKWEVKLLFVLEQKSMAAKFLRVRLFAFLISIERKCVTSSYHGSKVSEFCLSWRRKPFASSIDGIVWAIVLFLSAIMQSQESCHTCSFFCLPYLQDHGLLRSKNFASMASWSNDWRCKSTVNGRLPLLFGQTIQSVQNKDVHVVQIKPKAMKFFKSVVTSGEIAPHQHIE